MCEKINPQAMKSLNRTITFVKVFLAVTPLLAYAYVTLKAGADAVTLQEVLETTPSITVVFLLAMLNAYIAYLLHLMQTRLNEGDCQFAAINIPILLLAELMTGNVLYFVMLAGIFYQLTKAYGFKMGSVIKGLLSKATFVRGGGSVAVMSICLLCLFITLRLQ